jgi:hypothetical protein
MMSPSLVPNLSSDTAPRETYEGGGDGRCINHGIRLDIRFEMLSARISGLAMLGFLSNATRSLRYVR